MRLVRLIVVALAASLLAPLVAWGLNDGYHGTTDTGGLIAVRVDYDRNEQPTRVHSLRWANIPVSCGTSSSATSGDVKLTMKVDSRGAFKGSAKPDIGDAKLTISGRFKHDPSQVSGKFQIKGTLPACSDADTGKLGWEMTRK